MARTLDGMVSARSLAARAGEPSFSRGESYVKRVRDMVISTGDVHGTVRGQRTYAVSLTWSGGALDGYCTCPHAADGTFCKHLVALGLAAVDSIAPESAVGKAVEDDVTSRYLETLDESALRSLVRELVSANEDAARLIEVRAAVAMGDGEAAADELMEAVQGALRTGGFVDYRRSVDVARDAQRVLDELEAHLDAGGAADLVWLPLQKATTRLRKIMLHADDSGGSIGDAGQRAADLFARACRDGSPDPVKLARWLVKFRVDSPGWPNIVLEDFAPALDDRGLKVYRKAVVAADQKHAQDDHWHRFELDRMLLELADYDDDVDRAVVLLLQGEHPQYGGIIERLDRAERHSQAMTFVDRAVADGRLSATRSNSYWISAEDVAARYLDAGRGDDALAMLRQRFSREPGTTAYRLLLTYAARLGQEQDQREWVLATAEEMARKTGSGAVLVGLHLADGDVDAAWQAADDLGPGYQWRALAEVSAGNRPKQTADLYRPDLERSLVHPDSGAYPGIAQTLVTMRALYEKAGLADEFDEEIRQIRETYRRRPSLQKAMDKASLPRA